MVVGAVAINIDYMSFNFGALSPFKLQDSSDSDPSKSRFFWFANYYPVTSFHWIQSHLSNLWSISLMLSSNLGEASTVHQCPSFSSHRFFLSKPSSSTSSSSDACSATSCPLPSHNLLPATPAPAVLTQSCYDSDLSRIDGPSACRGCILSNIAALLAACSQLKWKSSCLFSFLHVTKLTTVPLPTSREPRIISSRCKRAEEYKCFSPQMELMDVMKH